MSKSLWLIVFACAVLIFAILVSSICYLFFAKRETFTREKFAFLALSALGSSLVTIVAELADKSSFWQMLESSILQLKGLPAPAPEPPHLADHLLMVIMWLAFAWVALRFFNNWTGAVSQRHYDNERFHRRSSIVEDGASELRRLITRSPNLISQKTEPDQGSDPILLATRETLAWHLQARDLLSLENESWEFLPQDWHPKARCWIGRDRRTRQNIFAYCESGTLTDSSLIEFVAYTRRLNLPLRSPSNTSEYLVVIREAAQAANKKRIEVGGQVIIIKTEDELVDRLVDFSDYFIEIIRRVEREYLPDSSITLFQTYTPTHFRSADGQLTGSIEDYVREWVGKAEERHLALLGEYGQGKSSTALMMTYHMIKKPERTGRIPILVELRGASPKSLTAEKILAGWAYHYRFSAQAVMKLHDKGKLLLILDGFDEISEVGDPESRLSHFRTLWSFVGDGSKILITGRPNLFLDNEEMKTALVMSAATASGPYCEAMYLLPLTLRQIDEALRWCKEEVRTGIVLLAMKDPKFYEIVSRGSLLYVVSQLWERERLWEFVPLTSARILELFLESSFRRQSQKGRVTTQFMILSDAERKYFMLGVAAYMSARDLPNQIDKVSFSDAVRRLYDCIPETLANSPGAALERGFEKSLKLRLKGQEDPLVGIENDVRASGILVVDHTKSVSLRFAHKSFLEFLTAKSFAGALKEKQDVVSLAVCAAAGLRPKMMLQSAEVTSFFSEVLMESANIERRRLAMELYSRIVAGPATRARIPLLVQNWILVLIWYSRRLARLTLPRPSEAREGALRLPLLLMTLLLILLAVLLTWSLHEELGKRDLTLISILPPLAIGSLQVVALEYIRNSDAISNIRLWLACCETLRITPSDVSPDGVTAVIARRFLKSEIINGRR